MSLQGNFRNGSRGTIWSRAVLASVVFLAVLAARNVPPHFPKAASAQSAISADSHHDQRPRFNINSSKWSAPTDIFVPAPPTAESVHVAPAPQLFCMLQSKGFHYNRPPPLS